MKLAIAALGVVLAAIYGVVVFAAYSQTPTPDPCMSAEDRERLRELMLDALDEAFRAQIEHLFEVWMRAGDDKDQPSRVATGARRAVRAHVNARAGALAWNPPSCR